MSTKRTVINADEELVIKGKLTIEGNVTQIETTQQVTNLEGNVFTINSDGSNTSAVLVLNSNGTVASFTFDDANGSIVVNKPINFGFQNITTTGNITGANIIGTYLRGDGSNITSITTSIVTEGTNLYFTSARVRGNINVIDAGGDGAIYYSSANGNITYVGPSQSEANARIDARLSGGDGINYTAGLIDVDNTVVRTTGDQTITGNTSFVGTTSVTGNIEPTAANTYNLGSWENHFGYVFANVLHAEYLDLEDANISDIHNSFYVGSASNASITRTGYGLIFTHNATGAYYEVNPGAGLEIDGNGLLSIDNTVITTAGGTINGNLTINGQLNYQNVVDSYVTDTIITLNANAIVNNHVSIVAHRPTATDVEIRWNEDEQRWQFTNDGNTYVNIVEISDLDGGNGLILNGNGLLAVGHGDGIIVDADNVSVDSTVLRTSGDQNIAGIKTFTGELSLPTLPASSNNSIYVDSSNNIVYARLSGISIPLTPVSDVGEVEDVGSSGIDLYAGYRNVLVSGEVSTTSWSGAYYRASSNLVINAQPTIGSGPTNITLNANANVLLGEYDTAGFISSNTFVIPANSSIDYVEVSAYLHAAKLVSGAAGVVLSIYKNGNVIVQTTEGSGVTESDVFQNELGNIYSGVSVGVFVTTGKIKAEPGDTFYFQAVSGNDGDFSVNKDRSFFSIDGFKSVSGNVYAKYHGIKSIDDGTYTALTESSNVITVDANITAIRGAFSAANIAGYGGIGYDSANGVFNYSGVTDAQIRGLFSGSGLISYDSANGSITTSADNYGGWTVQTDSGAGAIKTITSGETLTIQSGTGITVTNTGNVITITNSSTADITGVSAGNGLVGGGNNGDVTLNIGAGDGITVNADDIAVNVSYVRNQFSALGDLTYNASTGVFSFTNDAGDIEAVTAGNGLVGGGTSGTVTLDIGAGTGITVNADNIAVNMGAFSTTDLAEGANLYFTSARANSAIDAYLVGGNGLTYSSGTFAVGAGTGITVNADNVALTSGIITTGAKTYGTASDVPAITVDTYGRVTSISNTSISITVSQVSDFTSAANTAIDARVSGGNGLTYSGGILAVGAGSYITVGADTVAVDASTTNTAGKVVARDGAGNVYANYFVGTATAAQYADLAENYLADADYLPGTVLVFGGDAEVTAATTYDSTRVAGVVTTQPAHVMNSHLVGPNVACIALRGRVPVKVKGVVRKGDVLVTAGEGHIGYAVAALYPRDVPAAAMVGKAITDKLDAGPGVVEALI